MYNDTYMYSRLDTPVWPKVVKGRPFSFAESRGTEPEAGLSGAGHHQGVAEIRGALGVCHGQEQAPWTGGDGCWMLRSWIFLLILEL